MATEYERLDEISSTNDGLTVKLVLHKRYTNERSGYHTTSWRAVYPVSKQNRRFYRLKNGDYWYIPCKCTLEMMNHAISKGIFDQRYDDKYERHGGGKPNIFYGNSKDQIALFSEIILPNEQSVWPDDTIFVIAEEPGSHWRKVMIASKKINRVTFRSLTTCTSYRPLMLLSNNNGWHLDNSMIDCDPAVMREFHRTLRDFLSD